MQRIRLLLPAGDRAGRAVLLLALGLSVPALAGQGCGPGPRADPCLDFRADPPTLEVGEGDEGLPTFKPLPSDGAIELHPGPQGGYHIYLQGRVTGVCPDHPVTFSRAVRETPGGPILRFQSETMRMVDDGTGTRRLVFPQGQRTFICPSLDTGIAMAGRPLYLEATIAETGTDPPVEAALGRTVVPTCAASDAVCSGTSAPGCAAP